MKNFFYLALYSVGFDWINIRLMGAKRKLVDSKTFAPRTYSPFSFGSPKQSAPIFIFDMTAILGYLHIDFLWHLTISAWSWFFFSRPTGCPNRGHFKFSGYFVAKVRFLSSLKLRLDCYLFCFFWNRPDRTVFSSGSLPL